MWPYEIGVIKIVLVFNCCMKRPEKGSGRGFDSHLVHQKHTKVTLGKSSSQR